MRSITVLTFASLALVACGGPGIDESPPNGTATGSAGAAPTGTGSSGGSGVAGAPGAAGTGGGCAGSAGGSATAQILAPVGAPTIATNAVEFTSECHDDEVVTGIAISGGEWGSVGVSLICTYKMVDDPLHPEHDGLLGMPRVAKQRFEGPPPVYGGACPGDLGAPIAYGIVLSFGFETTTQTNVLRDVGLVCGPGRWPSAPPGPTVIVHEPNFLKKPFTPLESPTSFQLDCTGNRYLTGLVGIQEPSAPTPNTMLRLGGICDVR